MPLDKEQFVQKLEEYKEVGHEYRYRDQLMVQEFSLTAIAAGVLMNAIVLQPNTFVRIIIQIAGLLFLMLLTLHLRNTNEDRRAALSRKDVLRTELEFGAVHLNVAGNRRVSAPRLMVCFTGVSAIAWAIWTFVSIWHLTWPPNSN